MKTTVLLAAFLAVPLLSSSLLAQEGKADATKSSAQSKLPKLPKLIQSIANAVRDEKAPKKLHAFRAQLRLEFKLENSKGKSILQPKIWYRSKPLALRVEIEANRNQIEYVRNGRQLWLKSQGQVQDLSRKKEYQRDREQANDYLRIARLVPRLIFPDQILQAAAEPKGPGLVEWRINKRFPLREAYELSFVNPAGDNYPLQSLRDHDGPQQLAMLIDTKSFLPLAYRYYAMDAVSGKKISALEELIFIRPRSYAGMQLPTQWIKRVEDPKTHKMQQAQHWYLEDFTPNPEFSPLVFSKPR
ncbi:MAG: hypothetical protein CSA62_11080 [Planctomycetota bacterium]|nr:MAG: hypothetical protein CSA62_11080 [Planctomycetota bacterium]